MKRAASKKWLWLALITFVILAVIAPVAVWAASPTWHTAINIETNAGYSGRAPQVAISGLNVVTVWHQYSVDNLYRIYSNRSADGGANWDTARLIDANNLTDAYYPQVVISGLNVVAVWQQSGRIYRNLSTDGGINWVGALLIDAGATGAENPQLAMSGTDVVAVWQQSDGSNSRIYSNRSSNSGSTWLGAQTIDPNNSTDAYYPQVSMSNLNVVAVWEQSSGSNDRIYRNHSTNGGAGWGTAQPIDDGLTGSEDAQVAISGLNVVAVWEQSTAFVLRIHSNCSTDGGANWGTAQLIETIAVSDGQEPQVVISGQNVITVWSQEGGSNDRIYSNHSTNGGTTWGTAQVIDANAGDGEDPALAISGRNVVAVWAESNSTEERIYSNSSSNSGTTWGAAQLIEANVGYWGNEDQVAISGLNVVAVWDQAVPHGLDRIYSNYATLPAEPVRGVGGEVIGVNKLGVLTPWLVLGFTLMISGTIFILSRRRGS
jgi:hypothetical protein